MSWRGMLQGVRGSLARYHLQKTWPFRIEVGPLNVSPSESLLETVTLICDHVRRVAL